MRGFTPVGAIICFLRLFTMSRSLKRETKANWASMKNYITEPQEKFVIKITASYQVHSKQSKARS